MAENVPITNQFEPYCVGCPEIEPAVHTETFLADREVVFCEIVVKCNHTEQCKRLTNYLKGALNE